jgi:RimJ/RimL family protein N-acetyltransferase
LTELALHVPELGELDFRQKLLSDPESMSYNKGYRLKSPGYHNDTGCIDFPREDWDGWYARWVGAEPERFYAYLKDKSSGSFVGEVSLHETDGPGVYEMGIVLHSSQRGRGYSHEGIRLLLEHAFGELHAGEVTNCFEPTRRAALKIHLGAGFEIVREENSLLYLNIKSNSFKEV